MDSIQATGSLMPLMAVGGAALLGLGGMAGLAFLLRRRAVELNSAKATMARLSDLAGVLSARVDAEGRWQQVPQGLCQLLGLKEAELIGTPVVECLHPDDQANAMAHCAELVSGRRLACAMEARFFRGDGGIGWLQLDGAPVSSRSGRIRYIQVILRDISEARAVAQALKDSEEKFRTLSEHINCGVFLYTDVFHYINPGMERITGYPAEELLGEPFWKPVHPDEQDLVRQRGEARRRGEDVPLRYMMKLRRKDGTTIYADFIARAVTLGGKVYGLGTAFDITDRVRATEDRLRIERQMLESQKLESLGLLAGGIAHDFNNLLTVILGNASILLEEAQPGSLVGVCAKTVVDTCQRASDLTRQMLAYSGKGRFLVEPLDLNSTVKGITALIESSLPKLIEVRYGLAEGLPGLEADRSQLQQVILNLMTNAAEALDVGRGTITLNTGFQRMSEADIAASFPGQDMEPGPFVFFEVKDTGPGMDPATQARVFEPFFSTKGAGRGLGLAAMQGIVRGHKGGIWIYSEASRGTSFRVTLPALPSAVPVQAEAAKNLEAWRGSGLVLLVDDEAPIRALAAMALARAGFAVVEAADGREGVALFRQHADHLKAVVLDLVMPVLGGELALAEMMGIAPEVPVVLTSGYAGPNPGPGLAVRPFLQKPYTVAELLEKLRSALDG